MDRKLPNLPGIYKITNIVNGKFYIGSAVNLRQRRNGHRYSFKKNTHYNKYFQRSYNKYGKESFTFNILLFCEKEELIRYEQFFIDTLKPEYNLSPAAGSNLGYKYTAEQRKNVADAIRRRPSPPPMSEENRELRRVGMLGKQNALGMEWSKEQRKELSKRAKKNWRRGVYMGLNAITWDGAFISPEGERSVNVHNLKKFCEENSISYSGLKRLFHGETSEYKGWTFVKEQKSMDRRQ